MDSCNIYCTHEAEPIVHCLEVIDNCTLILALLPAPRVVGHPIEVAQCVRVMYAHQAHNLRGLQWGTALRNFRPFGKVLSA